MNTSPLHLHHPQHLPSHRSRSYPCRLFHVSGQTIYNRRHTGCCTPASHLNQTPSFYHLHKKPAQLVVFSTTFYIPDSVRNCRCWLRSKSRAIRLITHPITTPGPLVSPPQKSTRRRTFPAYYGRSFVPPPNPLLPHPPSFPFLTLTAQVVRAKCPQWSPLAPHSILVPCSFKNIFYHHHARYLSTYL